MRLEAPAHSLHKLRRRERATVPQVEASEELLRSNVPAFQQLRELPEEDGCFGLGLSHLRQVLHEAVQDSAVPLLLPAHRQQGHLQGFQVDIEAVLLRARRCRCQQLGQEPDLLGRRRVFQVHELYRCAQFVRAEEPPAGVDKDEELQQLQPLALQPVVHCPKQRSRPLLLRGHGADVLRQPREVALEQLPGEEDAVVLRQAQGPLLATEVVHGQVGPALPPARCRAQLNRLGTFRRAVQPLQRLEVNHVWEEAEVTAEAQEGLECHVSLAETYWNITVYVEKALEEAAELDNKMHDLRFQQLARKELTLEDGERVSKECRGSATVVTLHILVPT
mmetsp:Transcript_91195/g.253912  ORF Transcript_91195/g.253912 Transcript_91195/m.253912 type:complete len:335 (+) Transcript_91195:838-1842(+)